MPPRGESRGSARERIAREAARLMLESGVEDYRQSKLKAAARLRISPREGLPSNDEVEAARAEYQRLFRSRTQPRQLERLRHSAVQAMRFLERFQPRLVGSVLTGTADEHSEVCLHLFSEPNEAVGLFLSDHAIPHQLTERRLRVSAGGDRAYPAYRFMADDVPIELVVFDLDSQRNPPLSASNGRAMSRAKLAAVQALLGGTGEPGER